MKFANKVLFTSLLGGFLLFFSYPYWLLPFDGNFGNSLKIAAFGNVDLDVIPGSIYCGIRDYASFQAESYKKLLTSEEINAAEAVLLDQHANYAQPQATVVAIRGGSARIVFTSNIFRWQVGAGERSCTRENQPKIRKSPSGGMNISFGGENV